MPKQTSRKKARTAALITLGLLVGLYYWQPQQLDFFPKAGPKGPRINLQTLGLFKPGARVAVVIAHPDDPEFYIGGTLLQLAQSGVKIRLIVCTDGDKAYYPSFLTNADENRRVRQQEQQEAAARYQAEVVFLHKPDGRLAADAELDHLVETHLKEFKAEFLLTFDPEYPPRIQHRDHLASARSAIRVAARAGVSTVLRFATHAPNAYVNIEKEWPTKQEMLAIHRSQFYGERLQRIRSMVENRDRNYGKEAGYPIAEGFRVSRL